MYPPAYFKKTSVVEELEAKFGVAKARGVQVLDPIPPDAIAGDNATFTLHVTHKVGLCCLNQPPGKLLPGR